MSIFMDPIEKFTQWYTDELKESDLRIPSACCLSTHGADGFPNARFVSLKEIKDSRFIVTGPLKSRKGIEMTRVPQVALTFWWTFTERQVRVQGNSSPLTDQESDLYFKERQDSAKVLSIISRQGAVLTDPKALRDEYQAEVERPRQIGLKRPADWGGFAIEPVRIEFMQFREDRFHDRVLYQKKQGKWHHVYLQP